MASLQIENVRKEVSNLPILKGIDITCKQGEMLVLVGPSGCGKSTLLNLVAGLDFPSSGKILMDGQDISHQSPRARNVAMVFQSYALYPTMTVRENISFGLEMRKVSKRERVRLVNDVAETLQIKLLLDRKPSQLSGGQRQRVAMARAMVRSPEIFLFDEPLSNLDAKLRVEMRTEIKQLHHRLGTTILYVTHDQEEAMTLADRIAVMKDGEVLQVDEPRVLYDAPVNLFVAGFIGSPAMNFIPAEVSTVEGQIMAAMGQGIGIPLTAHDDLPKKIVLGIRPENIVLARPDQTLQNYFPFKTISLVVQPTGPDILLRCSLGTHEITARLRPEECSGKEEKLTLALKREKMLIFDPATGLRI